VDIEASIGPPGLCAVSVARMLERSKERVLPGDLRVREPELYDHALVMIVNAFKDKMVECPPWSLDDLERLGERVDTDRIVEVVTEARIRALAWIAADWMARQRASRCWREVRDRLGPQPPRRLYTWALARSLAHPHPPLSSRVLARVASDSAWRRAWALAAAGAGAAVSWSAPLVTGRSS
jgi:hypothetical protein